MRLGAPAPGPSPAVEHGLEQAFPFSPAAGGSRGLWAAAGSLSPL